MSLMVSGCGSGQFLGPTITPSPTQTPTETPTSTPTIIPTPTLTPTPTVDFVATSTQEAIELNNMAMGLCNENKMIPESSVYDPASSPSPILYCDGNSCQPISDLLTAPTGFDLTNWTPKNIKDLQLVLCYNTSKSNTRATGKFCNYYNDQWGSLNVPTYQVVDYYDLYVAKTGVKLHSLQVSGQAPDCPYSYDIPAGGPAFIVDPEIIGISDDALLFNKLFTYLGIPIPTLTP